jgi:GT2 family glycosyltransferase
MAHVDVVIVSYNSGRSLRDCVEPLAGAAELNVIVVDNASPGGGLESVAGLEIDAVQLDHNGGFSHGCNVGWRRGTAPFVLFLNPDTRTEPADVLRLAAALEAAPEAGIVAPLIRDSEGSVDFSQRRFPQLRSTYARAFFLHRLFPTGSWTDELVRDLGDYEHPTSPAWVSGACLMIRRVLLERLDGWDERFFMYAEDTDLCKRVRDAGYDIRFLPDAAVAHEGGASAPRPALLPVLVESRLRYAEKHTSSVEALAERAGLVLEELARVGLTRGESRRGHARALRVALGGRRATI